MRAGKFTASAVCIGGGGEGRVGSGNRKTNHSLGSQSEATCELPEGGEGGRGTEGPAGIGLERQSLRGQAWRLYLHLLQRKDLRGVCPVSPT